MESDIVMDRLLYDDVGYGKTGGYPGCLQGGYGQKQVAVLAPTTILAQQHLIPLSRFADFPCSGRTEPLQVQRARR